MSTEELIVLDKELNVLDNKLFYINDKFKKQHRPADFSSKKQNKCADVSSMHDDFIKIFDFKDNTKEHFKTE